MSDPANAPHPIQPPTWLAEPPVELRFGTSGLRGRVVEMTDLEVYLNTRGFLAYLGEVGDARPGEPVAIGQDLRRVDPTTGLESSPRIARAVAQAVRDAGFRVVSVGQVPTPALALHALGRDRAAAEQPMACIMVTGSHIPADRNGVKFYKKGGEVLKADEPGILAAVRQARHREYAVAADRSLFDDRGMLRRPGRDEPADGAAGRAYVERYLSLFPGQRPLAGRRIVHYEHSAVGRELVAEILAGLGAEVIGVDRSDAFVPVDTEDVTAADEERFRGYVDRHRPDAIVSTDGDSDRPLVVDEQGRFQRGDTLGIVTAELLGARLAAVPISTSDALDLHVAARAVRGEGPVLAVVKTRIGSPYVIAAMQQAIANGAAGVVGWEANGGFLTGSDFPLGDGLLPALPTRDAMLPILAVLLQAARRQVPVSQLFDALPARATRAGLLDDFPPDRSRAILAAFQLDDPSVEEVRFEAGHILALPAGGVGQPDDVSSLDLGRQASGCRERLAATFSLARGFGPVVRLNYVDGVRVWFATGEVAHLRPSGNAPQFRIYAVADSQARADGIVASAIAEPDGLLRRLERAL